MSFSENLHYLRKRDKVTQEELADKLGVSRQSVSKWETGEAYPETEKLLQLCDLFGVSLDGLMRGDLTKKEAEEKEAEPAGEKVEKEIKLAEPKAFKSAIDKFSRAVAAGVFLILFGVACCVLLSGVSETMGGANAEITGIMSGVAVILAIAVAVFLFIFYGMNFDRFRREFPVAEPVYGEEEIKAFSRRFIIAVACLVSGILLDVILLIVLTTLIDGGIIAVANIDAAICVVVAIFLCALSFIVGGLVYFGIQRNKYFVEEYNSRKGRSADSPRGKIEDAICGAVMLSAVALFLVLGFVWNLWHPGWVVFPVGGIICGIVSLIMGASNKH